MSHLSKALDIFSQKLSVNQGSFNSIIKESNPLQFAEDTYMLHTAKRLAQEVKNKSENLRVLKNKFKLFNNCTDPTEIAVIIDILNNNNLLTKENLELVSKQTNLDDLNSAIRILEENRLLDQKNFDRIIKEANRYKHESVTIPDLTSDTHSSINDLHKIEEDNHSPTLENKNKAETSGLSFSGDTTQDHLIKTPPQQGNTSSSYLAMFTIPLQWLVSPIQVIKSYSLQFFASLYKFTSLYPEGQSTLAIESSEDHKQQTLALAPEDSDKDKNKPSDTTTQPHEAIIPSVSAQQKANTVELTSASTYSHDSPRFFNDQSTRNKQDPEQRETSKHISYR